MKRENEINKSELIELVAARSGITYSQSENYMHNLINTIYGALKTGQVVNIGGFGKFSVRNRKERMGVNPRKWTEKILIPAGRTPKFSAGVALKDAIKVKSNDR